MLHLIGGWAIMDRSDNSMEATMDKVECVACGEKVPHVSQLGHMCDACEEACFREMEAAENDMEANGETGSWCIVGKYANGNGGGVLAWCASQRMARAMLPEIASDPQYTDVYVDFF